MPKVEHKVYLRVWCVRCSPKARHVSRSIASPLRSIFVMAGDCDGLDAPWIKRNLYSRWLDQFHIRNLNQPGLNVAADDRRNDRTRPKVFQ